MAPLIAITGFIGSGKSAVCRCLAAWGYSIYDCDSRAKALMDKDTEIHRRLCMEISPVVVAGGRIDREKLASIVFSDKSMLATLNGIVHRRVIDDLRRWRVRHGRESLLFVETAILLESNLHNEVDRVWLVDASEKTSLRRASMRDDTSIEMIRARVRNQRRVTRRDIRVPLDVIDNDGGVAVIPQLTRLLDMATAVEALTGVRPLCHQSITTIPGQWKG